MTAREYNALVRREAQNQPLRGTRSVGGAPGPHHWRVSARRQSTQKNGWHINPLDGKQFFSDAIFSQSGKFTSDAWRIYIEPGTVNDRMSRITYKVADDPRGWEMPANYRRENPTAPTVDRKLSEHIDPPYLLAVAPSADGRDPGDFLRMSDEIRKRYRSIFRTREMWDCELWTASVFVTAEPLTQGIAWDRLGFPFPARNGRFRCMLRPQMPVTPSGTQLGGTHQLAELHLVRTPGKPERDRMFIEQRCFWSLWTANADISPFGEFQPYLDTARGLDGLAGGIAGAIAVGTYAFVDAVTLGALQEIADLYASASTVEFWTA
jgi:hypothetical protein